MDPRGVVQCEILMPYDRRSRDQGDETVEALIAELRRLVARASGDDPETLDHYHAVVDRLRGYSGITPEIIEQLELTTRWATDLFSAHGHEAWTGTFQTGAERLRSMILLGLREAESRFAAVRDAENPL